MKTETAPSKKKVRIAERVETVYGKHETCPLLDPATLNRTNSSTDPPRATETEVTVPVAERRSAPGVAVTLSATERRSSAQKRAHAEPLTAVRPEAPFASQLPSKHATPELNISCNLEGEAFSGKMRPSVLSADYASADVVDPEVALVNNLATTAHELGVQTGTDFWDQWRTDFLHWAFPFSLPAPASGPDYPQKPKFRRVADAPVLGPMQHLKHITGRVESSIRNSWE